MQLSTAQAKARALMEAWGLEGWSFGFDNAKRRCGVCKHTEKRIQLSRHYVLANDAAMIRDTILHEIAHALTGPRAGHGPKWQQTARALGARPERCNSQAVMPEAPWKLECTAGHSHGTRHRRNRKLVDFHACRCGARLRYVPNR